MTKIKSKSELTAVTIRTAKLADSLALINLRKKLFRETNFMLFEPEEFNPTEDEGREFISMFISATNCTILIALDNNQNFVGFMGAAGGNTNRTKHISHLFIGVVKDFWRQGIAIKLFNSLFDWSSQQNIKRLELTTAVNNKPAYELYLKLGFEVEGILRNNICLDGEFIDEYQMSLIKK